MTVPMALALNSPLLAWRDAIYIAAGIAGVLGLALLLLQPLLANQALPGLTRRQSLRCHQISGMLLALAIIIHVAALWVTSPPDVVDALLFVSPTPFSAWGVVAMWAAFASALIAGLRRKILLRYRVWRALHLGLGFIVVVGTVIHAALIDGTMEPWSKHALSGCVLLATFWVIARRYLPAKRKTGAS